MSSKSPVEETFISHLVELRNRLVKASIGIAVVCAVLFYWPGPSQIYDFIAAPMIASLPAGSKMIATGVISPFLVPMKVTLVIAFIVAAGHFLVPAVHGRRGLLLLLCVWPRLPLHQ
jgi:sec-independent protein translocase protein TatC